MTLANGWAIDGQTTQAVVARLQLQSATRSGNGVVDTDDFLVRPLAVPGAGVIVGDGALVALGREAQKQGSYWVPNIGDAQVSLTATTSAGPRSDLVYLRVEDPTVDGTPWTWDPATDLCWYLRVWEGCPSTTEDIPAGETGVALARIDRPASTATVTADNIKDVRPMLDPRTLSDQLTLVGSWTTPDSVGNTVEPAYEEWPSGAHWDIYVPPWATQLVVSFQVFGVQYRTTGGPGGGGSDAQGKTRVNFGGTALQAGRHWIRGTTDYTRTQVGGGDTFDIPKSWRGTTKTLKLEGTALTGTGSGKLEADGGSIVMVQYTFRQSARNDVPDYSPS